MGRSPKPWTHRWIAIPRSGSSPRLIGEIRIAMLTTTTGGRLVSEPSHDDPEGKFDGKLWFAARREITQRSKR